MRACTTDVRRKQLVDPAACGVRLGVELRAAAEQMARQSGMCLSHWIKRLVEQAVSATFSGREAMRNDTRNIALPVPGSARSELDSAFAREMEQLNDR